ncbi:MAG TPA: UDP-N-acetylmuramate--L-alanine ligase [Herpetosiphon sp.]|uniref:UDP-N-acetylmuramate--L-alanine ligase n=1 Tax=Herpetosiphon aurantiacus (strain ATCC 23779 / DSM 785 / 114-95) TaxID=316274 RepID=A9B409_HERA2|nr:UDP-N-acetylmuramate--L-alanine ligase [Herpetosiphon sp.]ABX06145.1 UDP-N-acetylmuramate--alanine ligase [Herpetosiphon aurantiacus DSM 785]HBW51335.1 UDP-N-acetylmuramate--L-alanine ligase [Herpetosiphon sp.]
MHTHIVGIGGSGMSSIATLLLERGDQVSGCDRAANAATTRLADHGVSVEIGHSASHVQGIDRLLVTSALPLDHIEIVAAHQAAIPVLTRHDLWREWSAERPTLAVTGTHGKTTTTAMLAVIFKHCGYTPGFLIGAEVPALGASAAWGQGPLVLEADEYARTFLALSPAIGIITNLDWDHVDIYPSQAEYDAAFREFAIKPSLQHLVLCGDDLGTQRVLADVPAIRCGLTEHNDWRATAVQATPDGMLFELISPAAEPMTVQLAVSGEHNVRNALLALAAAHSYGIDLAVAVAAIAHYQGAARRFEPKGQVGAVRVFDDYAHHPVEIRATLAAARKRFPAQRIVAYFQPHTFSRLEAFLADFQTAFEQADLVRIGAVYGARETSKGDPTAQIVAGMQHPNALAVGDLDQAFEQLLRDVQAGDVVLTLGAGDGVVVGERLVAALR